MPINLHLLVSPEDDDHVERTKECLGRLTAKFRNEQIACTRENLIEFGRIHTRNANLAAAAAYRKSLEQFKVDYSTFMDWYRDQTWLARNSLLAIDGGKDGVRGLRRDSGYLQYQIEMIRDAQIVFSAQPTDRNYFLGKGTDSIELLHEKYGGPRPCLHGSDAHDLDKVLAPDLKRRCWIKAAPTFDGLRQVLYEPEARVWIGETPPQRPDPERVITSVSIRNHRGWFASSG